MQDLAQLGDAPPQGRRWMYYLMGVSVDVRFRDWVLRDIESPAWIWRQGFQMAGGILLGFLIAYWITDGSGTTLLGGLIGSPVVLLLTRLQADSRRRRAVAYYEKKWSRSGQS